MKRTFLLLLFGLFILGGVEAMNFDAIMAMDCDSWAAGFIEAFEIYTGDCLDADTYNATYSNLVDYCNGQ